MAALAKAFSNFSQAISNVAFAVVDAFVAVVHAIIQLGGAVIKGVFDLFDAAASLFTELVQDTVGFVFTNFFVLLILGGAYWVYTNYYGGKRRR
ncbi:hypothetical protein BDY19DRAFT_996525 [Irpex rosettiformis]|uniref:Uncharacterized protein n=1 Tax=Irpex rosettiformis TaxID=378272 RepID=A0ACB8TUG0_9APHY|nr:hypothetical protein BDY19DRAFT_996525 [Irpex rosettiformis]